MRGSSEQDFVSLMYYFVTLPQTYKDTDWFNTDMMHFASPEFI